MWVCVWSFYFFFKYRLLYIVGSSRKQTKKVHTFFFFFLNKRKHEWCRTLTLEKIERWNHNESFLMCDSVVVTLVTVWVIIRSGKGQGRTILNILPPLSFDTKRNAHIHYVQNVASSSENNMEGLKQQQVPVGQDTRPLGCTLGSAFLGESLGRLQCCTGPAAVERRQFSSLKAHPTIAGGREERTGSRRGWVPKRRVCQKDLAGSGAAGLRC